MGTSFLPLLAVLLAGLLVLSLCGCAALRPTAAVIEFDHTSHVTQHEPFCAADKATDYGANVASLGLKWQPLPHTSVVIEDGLSLDRHYPQLDSYGGLMGPREVFNARVTQEIPLR